MHGILLAALLGLSSQPPTVSVPDGWTDGSPNIQLTDDYLVELRSNFSALGKDGQKLSLFAVLETQDEEMAIMVAFEKAGSINIEKFKKGFDKESSERGGRLIASNLIEVQGTHAIHAVIETKAEDVTVFSDIFTITGRNSHTMVLFYYPETMAEQTRKVAIETVEAAEGVMTPESKMERFFGNFKAPNPFIFLILIAPFLLVFEWLRKRQSRNRNENA